MHEIRQEKNPPVSKFCIGLQFGRVRYISNPFQFKVLYYFSKIKSYFEEIVQNFELKRVKYASGCISYRLPIPLPNTKKINIFVIEVLQRITNPISITYTIFLVGNHQNTPLSPLNVEGFPSTLFLVITFQQYIVATIT